MALSLEFTARSFVYDSAMPTVAAGKPRKLAARSSYSKQSSLGMTLFPAPEARSAELQANVALLLVRALNRSWRIVVDYDTGGKSFESFGFVVRLPMHVLPNVLHNLVRTRRPRSILLFRLSGTTVVWHCCSNQTQCCLGRKQNWFHVLQFAGSTFTLLLLYLYLLKMLQMICFVCRRCNKHSRCLWLWLMCC